MSSSSTVRLYNLSKTYGRPGDPSNRSFDEMMDAKSAPAKPSAAHTKWGNTNYAALRDRKKQEVEAPKSKEVKTENLDDPFSFDTDEKGKTGPTKVQSNLATAPAGCQSIATASYQRNTTRLPASRIFTQGQVDESSASTAAKVLFSQGQGDDKTISSRNSALHCNDSSSTSLCAIARPGRTYTHSHEGRIRSSPTKRPYFEVGKTVKRDFSVDAMYSIESHKSVSNQMSPRYVSPSHNPYKTPQRQKVECNASSSVVDDIFDIFPVSHKPLLGSSNKKESQPHIRGSSCEPPVKHLRMGKNTQNKQMSASNLRMGKNTQNRQMSASNLRMGKNTQNRQMSASKSSVFDESQAQCKNMYPSTTGGSVLSSQQVRGNKDTLSVQNYKSKADIWDDGDRLDSFHLKNTQDNNESVWSKGAWSVPSVSSAISWRSQASSPESSPKISTSNETVYSIVDDGEFIFSIPESSPRISTSEETVYSIVDDGKFILSIPESSPRISTSDETVYSIVDDGELIFSGFPKSSPRISSSNETVYNIVDDDEFIFSSSTADSKLLMTKNQSAGDASRFARDQPAVRSDQPSTGVIRASGIKLIRFRNSSNTRTGGKTTGKSSSCKTTSKSNSAKSTTYSSTSKTSISSSSCGGAAGNSGTAAAHSKGGSDGNLSRRIQSGVKQYRIFKSRRPALPLPEEPEEAEDVPASDSSPTMPELDLELRVPFDRNQNFENIQLPPDVTENVSRETRSVEACSAPQEDSTTGDNSQKFQHADGRPKWKVLDLLDICDFPTLHAEPMAAFEAPSPSSGNSQELSHDALSSASNTQKEEDIPATPRRFFKSRETSGALGPQEKQLNKSKKFSYNARSWHQDSEWHQDSDDEAAHATPPVQEIKETNPCSDEEESQLGGLQERQMVCSVHWSRNKEQPACTSVSVNTEHKKLMVENVKMAHEVQESGETQDFIDDLVYLLDSLEDNQSVSIRALSTLQLAVKCLQPAFRMHLRAHGTLTRIVSLLHDACYYPSLSLSTAALLLMLSQDHLSMAMDSESLQLMLRLSDHEVLRQNGGDMLTDIEDEAMSKWGGGGEDLADLEKCRRRVQELLLQLQKESATVTHITFDCITPGYLALETLFNLASRCTEDWFKEELRLLGGLDHLVQTVHSCVLELGEHLSRNLDRYTVVLMKLDRCFHVLENISFMHIDNQVYLVTYNRGQFIKAIGRLLQKCVETLPMLSLHEAESEIAMKKQPGWIVFECLLSMLQVLLSLTHENVFSSTKVGDEDGLLQNILQCIINIQWCVPVEKRYDVLILSLGVMINMVCENPSNSHHLVKSCLMAQIKEDALPKDMSAVQALIQLFLEHSSAARQLEESGDIFKPSTSQSTSLSWVASDSDIQLNTSSAEKTYEAEKRNKNMAAEKGSSSKALEKTEEESLSDSGNIQENDESFNKALLMASKHMENNTVASYVTIAFGCVIENNKEYVDIIKMHLPEGNFAPMAAILNNFYCIMNLANYLCPKDARFMEKIINILQAC